MKPRSTRLRARRLQVEMVEPAEIVRPLPRNCFAKYGYSVLHVPAAKTSRTCRSCAWIQITSAGYSQLSGLDLAGRGIRATNARGCFDVPIAEWNIAMMVNLARNLRGMIRNQETRTWERPAEFQREIRGLTVGIWGYGGIGRETARLARAHGNARPRARAPRRGTGRRSVSPPGNRRSGGHPAAPRLTSPARSASSSPRSIS